MSAAPSGLAWSRRLCWSYGLIVLLSYGVLLCSVACVCRCPRSSSGHAAAGSGGAALQRTALVLAHPAPDAGVLAALQGPLKALVDYVAAAAHGLGIFDLQQR